MSPGQHARVPKDADRAKGVRSATGEPAGGFPASVVAAWVAIGALLCIAFPIALTTVGRERIVGFVADDAYYYFNVAANIAAGNGPTADGLTRTTGFHPLYAFVLAGLHWLTHPTLDGFVAQAVIVNALGSLLAGAFLGLAARRQWGATAGWAAALLWWTNPHAAHIVADGLEGGLYAATLALFLWRAVVVHQQAVVPDRSTGADSGTRMTWNAIVLGVSGSLAVLTRTDALLIVAAIALILLATLRTWTSRLVTLGSLAGLVACALSLWWWYCWEYTGSIVQGSAAVKREWNTFLRAQQGSLALAYSASEWLNYVIKCALKVPALKWVPAGIPLILAYRRAQRLGDCLMAHMLWVVPLLLGAAYCLFLDRPRTWYYIPALAMFTLLTASAVNAILATAARDGWTGLAFRTRSLLSCVVMAECIGVFVVQDASVLWRESDQVQGVRAAQWIEENIPADTRVGCWHSGIVQYYTPRVNVINLDGLANNDILAVLRGQQSMNEYWDEMKITRILGGPREKMGGYESRWSGKRLETCGLSGKLQCVVVESPQ